MYTYAWSVWTNIRMCLCISLCVCHISCENTQGTCETWILNSLGMYVSTDFFEPGDLKRCLRHNACSNPLRGDKATNQQTYNPQSTGRSKDLEGRFGLKGLSVQLSPVCFGTLTCLKLSCLHVLCVGLFFYAHS